MKIFLTFFSMALLIFGLACSEVEQEPVKEIIHPINPNGDSELALLMREMFDDGLRIKQQIMKGEQPEILKKFEKILTAEATEPEKAASQKYKHFANTYLESLESLKNARGEEAGNLYQVMVQNCMNCHNAMCPGPMVKIKKLYLKNL